MSVGWMLRLAAAAGAVAIGAYLTLLAIFGREALEMYSVVTIELSWVGFISLASYALYLNGFAAIGMKYRNRALVYAAQAIVLLNVLAVTVFYSALVVESFDMESMNGIADLIGIGISIAMVVLGWNILSLKAKLGALAVWYGSLEMLAGLTVIYIFPLAGVALDITLYALGIAILYKLSVSEK